MRGQRLANRLSDLKTVLFGALVAQLTPIVASVVIARLVLVSDYGTFSIWLGLALILSVVITGRFEAALAIIPDGVLRSRAVTIVISTATFAGLVCLISIPGLSFAIKASGWIESSGYSAIAFVELTGVTILTGIVLSFSQTLQSWAAADGRYRDLSAIRVTNSVTTSVAQIVAGIIYPSALLLLVAHMVGAALATLLSYRFLNGDNRLTKIRWTDILTFWRQFSAFPKFALPADLISAITAQVPLLFLGSRFGPESAGYLALTQKVLGAPISLLGKAFLDLFKRDAAQAYIREGRCSTEYLFTLKILAMTSAVFSTVVLLFADQIFNVAYGPSWSVSGEFAILLLPLFAMRFMASPLSYVVYIVGKQYLDLIWQLLLALVVGLSFMAFSDVYLTISAYSWAYTTMYAGYLYMTYKLSLGTVQR